MQAPMRAPQHAGGAAMSRKILYVDMDNVLVDFRSGLRRMPRDVEHASQEPEQGGLPDR